VAAQTPDHRPTVALLSLAKVPLTVLSFGTRLKGPGLIASRSDRIENKKHEGTDILIADKAPPHESV
jgi:hypothetical protein